MLWWSRFWILWWYWFYYYVCWLQSASGIHNFKILSSRLICFLLGFISIRTSLILSRVDQKARKTRVLSLRIRGRGGDTWQFNLGSWTSETKDAWTWSYAASECYSHWLLHLGLSKRNPRSDGCAYTLYKKLLLLSCFVLDIRPSQSLYMIRLSLRWLNKT